MEGLQQLPSSLQVTSIGAREEWIVKLAGEFDLASVDLVQHEIEKALGSDVASVVVDLTQLDFIDSSGLNVLVQADVKSRVDSNRLTFRGPVRHQVKNVLRLTELDHQLRLDETG